MSDPRSTTPQPLVTVVVPARNEEQAIGPCLDSLLAQDYTHLQVIVVDGASTDATTDVVKRYIVDDSRVELLHNPLGIIPVSLNLALAAARGPYLVRVDAHATVPADYVRRAVDHLATGRWGGVGGRKDGVGRTPAGRAVAAAMGSKFGVGGSVYHYGTTVQTTEHVPFGAYPVELARAIGGWDETLRVNQDFEFDYRIRTAGHELLFDPALVIEWESRQRVRDLFAQYRRYGNGKVKVARKHPRSLRARHLAPPVLVSAFAATAALAPFRRSPAVAVYGSYVAALTVATAATARSLDRRAAVYVAPSFLAMHVGWGVGALQGWTNALRGADKPSGAVTKPSSAVTTAVASGS